MEAFVVEQTEAVSWFEAGGLPSPRGHDTCEESCCVRLALISSSCLGGKGVWLVFKLHSHVAQEAVPVYTHFLSL